MSIANKVYSLFNFFHKGVRPILPLIILVIYTIGGAQLFLWCEAKNEKGDLEQQRQTRAELIERYAYEVHKLSTTSAKEKHDLTVGVLFNFTKSLGVNPIEDSKKQWTFINAVYYALTVYTTIGYGNIYPSTSAGQVLTIVYAFFGIPLTLITLIVLGGMFAKVCKILWSLLVHSLAKSTSIVSKDIEKQVKKLDVSKDSSKNSDEGEDLLSFPVSFLVVITVIWVFSCAALFTRIENDWDYGTSLYFTLISFTTIGFGDVLLSEYDHMIVVGLCVLIGLSLVSTILNVIQQQIEALAAKMDSDIDKNYKEALTSAYDEDSSVSSEKEGKKTSERKSSKIPGFAMLKDKLKIETVVSNMKLRDRLLYNAMSNSSKEKIKQKAEKRMNIAVVGTQTECQLTQKFTQTDSVDLSVSLVSMIMH